MKALHRFAQGWLLLLGLSTGLVAQSITSFSPTSAAAGSTVTITGTGFSSTPANDVVYFGAGRGTVTFANATSLSVTVPGTATYGPISVSVIGTGKVAMSKNFFNLKFSAGDIDAAALTVDQTISLGGIPLEPVVIDMNGDGKLDLLVTRAFNSPLDTRTISYLQNTSSGGNISFAPKVEIPTPQVSRKNYFGTEDNRATDPRKIIAADLDGDGKKDFVIITRYGVSVQRDVGTPGNPSFQLWQEFLNPDMTGGSWQMIRGTIHNFLIGFIFEHMGGAGAGRTGAMGPTLPQNGGVGGMPSGFPDNHLVWVPNYLTEMNANDAVVADFNGDGRPDIAIVYSGTHRMSRTDELLYGPSVEGRLRVFLNGGGSFNLASDLAIVEPEYENVLDLYSIAAANFRGNDTTDIVVAGSFDNYSRQGMVTVLANALGDGTSFIPIRNWEVYSRVQRVVVADFDGDGKPDVAYQSQDDNMIRVRRNTSPSDDMTFSDPVEISLQNGYRSMQVSDFDGDGKPDLVWACEGASGFKAARNTSSPGTLSFAPPLHAITSLSFQDAIAVADFSGDGKPDLISTKLSGDLTVIKNTIPPYSLSQSTVSVTTPVILRNGSTPVSLQIKDASGNTLGTTGLTVVFSLTGGGTSAGTFSGTTDAGGGLYTATFTGTNVGTANNVSASIGGTPISSTLPAVRVAGGPNSVAQSTVSISRPVVASGATAIARFQAKDANGDTLTTGGLAGVTFFLTGAGTSNGTFGTVTDSGNGKYYATFTATTAGTGKTISARISTDTVKTSLPTVTVNAGPFSTTTSILSIASNTILKYDTTTVTLQVKDGAGNNVPTGGLNVQIHIFGSVNPINNGKGYLTDVVDNQNGTYSSKFISLTTGSGTAITSLIYNSGTTSYQQVNSFPPPITINDRMVSLSLSTVGVGNSTLILGGDTYFYLYARNDKGEAYTATNLGLNFSVVGDGTSTLTPNATYQNVGGGVYQMSWHATGVGTATHVTTTINSGTITSTLPTIAVVPAGPGVTYPTYSQQAVPLDTTFYWNASTGATTYRVQIVADSLTGSIVIDTTGITATLLRVTGLQNYHTYYFRLTAMNAAIESGIWNERDFRTIISTPLQVFPPEREQEVGLPVSFGWVFSRGAGSYLLQVAADTGFSSLVIQKTLTDSITTDTLTGLATSTKYFWRVSASGDGGTTDFSTIRSFTTASVDSHQTRYYVKTTGNDGFTGTSWGTAFATMQQALSVASAGSEIWVGAGTYKPTSTLDRSISFQLKNGVAVYGGFTGTETNRSQRNWQSNVTILSGDIDGDATLANNSYHVVVGNTFATALLDGFTITGGNADGGQRGGGIYCSSGYPVLSNLIISNNHANDLGGGMYTELGNPTLTNVTFSANSSGDHGGGMYNERGSPTLTNCTFSNNTAIDGGGMWNGNYNYPGTSNPVFVNVVFKNNSTSHFGGGMYTEYGTPSFTNVLLHQNSSGNGGGIYNIQSNSTFANVTFSNNSASSALPNGGGGGMFVWLSQVVLKNVVLWGNAGSPLFNGEIYNGATSTVTLSNSILQDGMPVHGGYGIVNFYGGVDVDSGGNVYIDPLFLNAGAGDLRLTAASPAIDAGSNSVVTTISDPNGNPRIVGGKVDMGAYEYQAATSSISKAVSRSDSVNQFGNTKVELQFAGIAPGRSVLIFSNHYATAPDSVTFAGPSPAHYSPFRWVITKTGDLFASAALSLENVSSYPGVVDPTTLVIYHRSAAGSGSFSPLASTYDAGTDRLSATITSFSEFMIGSNNNPLPVQITNFTVAPNRLNAELNWKTVIEVNNYGFDVERRAVNSADTSRLKQITWTKAGFVRGSGTSSSPKDYGFIDKNLQAGRYAFRLKQIDNNGAVAYTAAAEVEVGVAPREFKLSQNYPNPFNPTTMIEFTLPEDGRAKVRVYDILGREIAVLLDEDRKAGVYQQVLFNASRFASGVYFATLEFHDKRMIKKMLLLK